MKEENYEVVVFGGHGNHRSDVRRNRSRVEQNAADRTTDGESSVSSIRRKRGTPSKITAVRSGTPTQHLVSGSTKE